MTKTAAVKNETPAPTAIDRAKRRQELESKHKALMSLFYYAKGPLERSDDEIVRQVAAEKAVEFKAQADSIKELIDAI